MDYLYSNPENERIIQGKFPKQILRKYSQEVVESLNCFEEAKELLVYFRDNPEMLYKAINSAINTLDASEQQANDNGFVAPFNLIINTSFNPAALNIDIDEDGNVVGLF